MIFFNKKSRKKKLSVELVSMRLVSQEDMDSCLQELQEKSSDDDQLIRLLERKNLITSFQAGRLKSNEFDGLVLGDNKLMYQNASGSFARVYRAASLQDGRMVGVKVLRQRWAQDPETVKMFRREAEVCKQFQHKNIVPIYDVGFQDDTHYFTMEFVEGGNLRDFITIRKKLSPVEAINYTVDICEGLEYANRLGYTHRDMKPTNVLMSIQGVAKLIDFGLAGEDDASGAGEAHQRAVEYGTLEKSTGAPRNDPRSDLYFVGTIFYELLSGKPPFPRTKDIEERKRPSRYSQVPSITTIEPDLPESVVNVLEKLMAYQPVQRYQSATDAIQDLLEVRAQLDDAGTVVKPAAVNPSAEQELKMVIAPPTILCVENRPKHQDVLREYLTKHGYRVLILSDVERAMNRIKENAPDCVVFMEDSIGAGAVEAFNQSLEMDANLAAVLVLSEKNAEVKKSLQKTDRSRILVQPIKIRNLRAKIQKVLQHQLNDSAELTAH
ncbi:protein kinase domain-containing protein [Gimesia maris]|uniref:Serine/threonine-protein kinase PrkC n=1 Tax=Gimesia maris TaxID=122 RepID=A0ABX5YSD7_9PLAN|nr:protein kinase [Gimesia maris]EDL61891.1 serine/threonine protein kinase [Gimesia maris DSM 8797]QEG18553.1 Serine/threonine-protein kinase PrkC [Gimesia maris]QGQ28487.1 protein kinase [Gimesia maris]